MRILAGLLLLLATWGNPAWAAPPVDHLSAPTVSDIGPTSFTVSWVAYAQFSPQTHYQVRVDHALYAISQFATAVTVGSRRPGTQVKVEVVTYHDGHVLGVSSATLVLMGPATPDPVYATEVTSTTFRLTWAPVPTATQYQIWRHPGELLTTVAATGDAPQSLVLGPFTPGASLTVHVVALNPSSPSAPSTGVWVQLKPPAPNIEVVAGEIGSTSFRIRWTEVDGAAGYSVYRNGEPFAVVPATTTTVLVTGCPAGLTARAKVAARNATGDSEFSNEVTVLLKPAAPDKPWATEIGSTSFVLNWKLVAGAESTQVFRDGEWHVANASAPATSVRLTSGFNPGDTASMTVKARNAAGDSEPSEELAVTLLGGATTPSLRLAGQPGEPVSLSPGQSAAGWRVRGADGRVGPIRTLLQGKPGLIGLFPQAAAPANEAALAGFRRWALARRTVPLTVLELFVAVPAVAPPPPRLGLTILEESLPAGQRLPVALTVDPLGVIRGHGTDLSAAALEEMVATTLNLPAAPLGPTGEAVRGERLRFEGLHRAP